MVFRIDLKIFIFLIVFYFTKQIELYLIIMLFAILHELSHLLVGLLLKMKVKSVTLMSMGLSIEFSPNKDDDVKQNINEIKKILVAIAGPLTNIAIIFTTRFLKINFDLKMNIIYSNLILAIFNLLPIYPLDGGRILKSILKLAIDSKTASIYTNKISNMNLFLITFLFSILIYYFKNIAILCILVYLWYIVLRENKIYRMKAKIYELQKYT